MTHPPVAFAAILLFSTAALAGAQTTSSASPSFDVVSIKPNTSGDSRARLTAAPGGRVIGTNVTLQMLIRQAYRAGENDILGGPAWIDRMHFDLEAKAADDAPMEQLQAMLTNMLADRFGLTVHREPRERDVYALVTARSDGRLGPRLRVAAPAAAASYGIRMTPGTGTGTGASMSRLAANLPRWVGRPVIDRTGLTGSYDFDLQWTPDPGTVNAPNDAPTTPTADAPSIFTALSEQLGLRLEPAKAPIDVLVIDSVHQPELN